MDLSGAMTEKSLEFKRKQDELSRRRDELETEQRRLEEQESHLTASHPQLLGSRISGDVMPEDFLDTLHRLENQVKLQAMRNKAKEAQIADVRLQLKEKERELHMIASQMHKVQQITGYRLDPETGLPSSPVFRHRGPTKAMAEIKPDEQLAIIADLEGLKQRVITENTKLQNIVRHKQQLIHKLSEEVAELDHNEERFYEKQSALNAHNEDLAKLTAEWDALRRGHMHADATIGALERAQDESRGTLDSLQTDKAFLRRRILDDADHTRTQEKAIKAQSFRLEQLQRRFELINNAVEDLKLHDALRDRMRGIVAPVDESACQLDTAEILQQGEQIDLALYSLLARDDEAIRASVDLKNIIIIEKEATIGALDDKISVMQMQVDDEVFAKNDEVVEFEQGVLSLNTAVWEDRERFNKEIIDIRQQNAKLTRQKQEMQRELAAKQSRK
eukprot:TRINITY_DN19629_c0_g1_i1.p1 TRINITY_DN19629_c0_g1~~TRINITY_DN19629_c0_g1_i1.p1  ORF type:complete len:489 (+),score=255.46 TRINITY_DN19629_c0_g1_i1:128-1468(+)